MGGFTELSRVNLPVPCNLRYASHKTHSYMVNFQSAAGLTLLSADFIFYLIIPTCI